MSNRNTSLGGTDWIDGETLDAADLNDTFDATIIRADRYLTYLKTVSDATQYSTTSSALSEVKTYTITGANGGLLKTFAMQSTLDNTGGDLNEYVRIGIEITGTNTGTWQLISGGVKEDSTNVVFYQLVNPGTYGGIGAAGSVCNIPILDDTVTIKILLGFTTDGSGDITTAYVDDIKIRAEYVKYYE